MPADNHDNDLIEVKTHSEEIFHGHLLNVFCDKVRLPNGDESVREWVKHPGAAAILPLTDDNEVILVRQYRYPIGKVTVEIPAGKLDKPLDGAMGGEDPLECAKRELLEETGYKADAYIYLTKIATTVGFTNEYIHIYLATGLVSEGSGQHLDPDEFINVLKIPLDQAVEMVWRGEIYDGKSCVAILMAKDFVKGVNLSLNSIADFPVI